jgi:hypothetical protein
VSDDPAGYALAVNLARRSLTKGHMAMVAAQACSEMEQTEREMARITCLSMARIGLAAT